MAIWDWVDKTAMPWTAALISDLDIDNEISHHHAENYAAKNYTTTVNFDVFNVYSRRKDWLILIISSTHHLKTTRIHNGTQ